MKINKIYKPLYTKKEKIQNLIIGTIQIIYISGFISLLIYTISNAIK